MSGWRRIWVVLSVMVGLYVLYEQSPAFISPAKTLDGVYKQDMARLQGGLITVTAEQVGTDTAAIRAMENAMLARQVTYAAQLKNVPFVAFCILLVALALAALAGGFVYLAGYAVEWAYRGFRPSSDPMAEASLTSTQRANAAAPEACSALPHQQTSVERL